MASQRIKWWAMLVCGAFALAVVGLMISTCFWGFWLVYRGRDLTIIVGALRGGGYSSSSLFWEFPPASLTPNFGWDRVAFSSPHFRSGRYVDIQLWMVALVFAAGVVLLRRSYVHGRPKGLCSCGYDLTGLAAGTLCPECGTGAQHT